RDDAPFLHLLDCTEMPSDLQTIPRKNRMPAGTRRTEPAPPRKGRRAPLSPSLRWHYPDQVQRSAADPPPSQPGFPQAPVGYAVVASKVSHPPQRVNQPKRPLRPFKIIEHG